jgi:hypothetical protein
MTENKLGHFQVVEPFQIEGHQVEHFNVWNVWDKSHDDIDYDHLHEDKKNEWDTWLNDVDARGGIHENSNSLNGSGW